MAKDAGSALKELRVTMKGIRDAATTINNVATSVQTVVDQNKDPLTDFARSGLYDFSLFLAEARILVDSLTRIINRIERDPALFFFGDSQRGVEAK